jgi:energy-converting hydrogenase Eha subunit B
MQMPLRFLEGSPFADYLVPGLILLGLFGIGSLVAAALVLLRLWYAPPVAFVIGSGQMIWIVVQLAIIDEFNWLQPAMFAVGLVVAVAASVWGWPVVRALLGRERRWEPR